MNRLNLTRSIWQQSMKGKFVRILVVVFAAFALFAFVYPDDLSEDDSACSQSEMLQQSPVTIPTPREQQAVNFGLLVPPSKSTSSSNFEARTISPTLISLSTCVLLC
jgi:hypothetical protein